MSPKPLIAFFKEIDKHDLPLVGGKGANLGEMTRAGFTVPNGFAVTVHAYDLFVEKNSLHKPLKEILDKTDITKVEKLNASSKKIAKLIKGSEIPKEVSDEVIKAYKKLSGRFKNALVAARSSATAEDLPDASFAGQQATFLNVKGESNLLQYIRECWSSLFTARAIFYREQNKISHENVKISVIVQKMIQSEVSGVIFTIDPVTNDRDRIIIEAVWGLGEMIVQGLVVPDKYVVQKDTFEILSKEVSDQAIQLVRKGGKNKEVKIPQKVKERQKISDSDIVKLAKTADKLQKHYYFPQDIEWAKEKNKFYTIQTRPITTLKKKKSKKKDKSIKIASAPILKGASASPGIGTGHLRILKSAKEISKVSSGDVLVAEMTSPDFVPAMKKASAIVTDKGGQTSHAAIVCRELGIPCVVGTRDATKKLSDGDVVTVDGSLGQVFLGSKFRVHKKTSEKVRGKSFKGKTATHLYVNLAEPELANKIAKFNVDGVGLLRAEFMIANIGTHPMEAIKSKTQHKFVDKLTSDLSRFCRAFGNRPVIYRATDFKTNEYKSLPGGEKWEPEEQNPMLGFRGAYRYITNPEVFNLELRAVKNVRRKYKNLWLMIPFVRSPNELSKVRKIVKAEGLFESTTFKFWMMVELPVNVILIDDFIKVGIDGISIGSNDLTMLVTGTDRDNEKVAETFNQRSKAIYWSLKRVIKACHNHGITSSICGQAVSVYDDLVQKLVKYGITSVSVNPDAIDRVRKVIYEKEKQIANKRSN